MLSISRCLVFSLVLSISGLYQFFVDGFNEPRLVVEKKVEERGAGLMGASGKGTEEPGFVYGAVVSDALAQRCEEVRRHSTLQIEAVDSAGSVRSGAGVVVSEDSVVTVWHVVAFDAKITGRFADGREFPLQVVTHDAAQDLAVLRSPKSFVPDYRPVPLAAVEAFRGAVCAIGSPYGIPLVVSYGQVEESLGNGDLLLSKHFLYPGNSGGPLINEGGYLVGVNKSLLHFQVGRVSASGLVDPTLEKYWQLIYEGAGLAVSAERISPILKATVPDK